MSLLKHIPTVRGPPTVTSICGGQLSIHVRLVPASRICISTLPCLFMLWLLAATDQFTLLSV